jgi:hypothetical protein
VSEVTLHPAPRYRDVMREQIRVTGMSLRREALVIAIVLGIMTVVIGIAIVCRRAETWFDSREWGPIGFFAFLFPFAVWRRERPFGPAFLWTLPVDRGRLALARVFAGWVWLMAALAVFVAWQVVLALLSGVANAETMSPFVFIGATGAYLLGSAVTLGLRHPLRWLFGCAGLFYLLGALNRMIDRLLGPNLLHSMARLWYSMPVPAQWAAATFLWLGAGSLALWAALARHGERR